MKRSARGPETADGFRTWATKGHRDTFPLNVQALVHDHLSHYAEEKAIFLKSGFVNPDHVHALIDLPTNLSVEEAVKLLKGESSHWINRERLVPGPFHWQKGYGAFSVSHTMVDTVCRTIARQELHHRRRSFTEELRDFVGRCGLEWREEG